MTLITKDNKKSFMEYYHYFHDSSITDLIYNYKDCSIELYVSVFWSGEPKIKDDGKYEINKKNLKIIFKDVYQFKFKEVYQDYIDDAYLKYIILDKDEYICFATDPEEPLISIVSKTMEYEEI